MLFYAAFIPGLKDFIADVLKERLADIKIRKLLDGAVLFETETSYDKLNFFCFNNIFAVISVMAHKEDSFALEKHIRSAIDVSSQKKDSNLNIIANNNKNFRTFRIVISRENVPASIDEKLRSEMEKCISRLSGLKVNRSLPDTEFWFLFRKENAAADVSGLQENFSVFMKRLTLHRSREKTLHKGELPPPLAWTLCRLANLAHTDTVLDPFCGYGSIPNAALKHFHITKFIACENNKEAASYTASRFQKRKNNDFTFYNKDFETLPSIIGEQSIDVIITDPPWGHYKELDNSFYNKMFNIFNKLLKYNGRAVMLCAKDMSVMEDYDGLKLQCAMPILLSGKKAVIYQFIKTL